MLYIFDCTFVVMMVHLWLVKMDEESNTFVYEKKVMTLIQKKPLLTVDHQRLTKSLISSNEVWDVELMKFYVAGGIRFYLKTDFLVSEYE